jgi:hypothetical protein
LLLRRNETMSIDISLLRRKHSDANWERGPGEGRLAAVTVSVTTLAIENDLSRRCSRVEDADAGRRTLGSALCLLCLLCSPLRRQIDESDAGGGA